MDTIHALNAAAAVFSGFAVLINIKIGNIPGALLASIASAVGVFVALSK